VALIASLSRMARTLDRDLKKEHTLEQTIFDLAHASANAVARHDVAFFAQLADAAFVYITADGEARSKQGYVQRYVEPPEALWLSRTLAEAQVRLYGGVAVLTGRLYDQLTFAGEPFEGEKWQRVSGHTSRRAQET
jgi:hypothetical protein